MKMVKMNCKKGRKRVIRLITTSMKRKKMKMKTKKNMDPKTIIKKMITKKAILKTIRTECRTMQRIKKKMENNKPISINNQLMLLSLR